MLTRSSFRFHRHTSIQLRVGGAGATVRIIPPRRHPSKKTHRSDFFYRQRKKKAL